MPVARELASLNPARPTLITIGVFDGVHIGHQALLAQLVRHAQEKELGSCVITFRQHPLQLFCPHDSPPAIASLPENIRLIKAQGVDLVLLLTFDAELAQIDAQTFVLLLQQYLKMDGLMLGWDFAMGRHREGTIPTLEDLGRKLGFSTCVMPPVMLNGEVVSSTAIRQALAEGNLIKANAMLGRRFSLEGKVVTGDGRGSQLGFPTANLDVDPRLALPASGVYVTLACLAGETHLSVTNIGVKPTFGGREPAVEVHLLDFTRDIYRKKLRVDFVDRLREEKRFETVEALQAQITQDIIEARKRLRSS
jgi:riboflavin kinase / FMN adenylyltransferase